MNGILPNGKQQFIDSNGNPLASGKVYYYIPSTTTFKNTYQDDAGTILNTNPIVLDANGQCIAYGTGSYRQQVYDVNNNLIWDVQVDSPATYADIAAFESQTAGSSGASLIGYNEGQTNAVGRSVASKLQETISVKDFGATGNGSTDDASSFTAAFTASKAITIPYGTYKLGSVISTSAPIVIYGEDLTSTLSNGIYINSTSGYKGSVQNLNFVSTANTGIGLQTNDTHLVKFDSISATGFQNGAEFDYSWSNNLINCQFHANSTGAVFHNNCNSFNVYSSSFTNNTNNGVSVDSSQKMTFVGCDFSNNTNYGFVVDSTENSTLQALGIKVDSSYTEGNTTDFFVGAGSNAVKVEGCVFTNNAHFGSKQYGYFVNNAINTQIINPDFAAAAFTGSPIYLASASQNTTIIPFISSQVSVQSGATVSTQTIQTGTLQVTLSSGGASSGTVNFPATYYQVPFVDLNIYETTSLPNGSLGIINIKNNVGVTGFYWEINNGPANAVVNIQWRSGN